MITGQPLTLRCQFSFIVFVFLVTDAPIGRWSWVLPPPAAPAAVCEGAAAGARLPQPLALPQTLPGGLHRSVHTMGRYSVPYLSNVLSRGEAGPELGLAGGRGPVGGQPQPQLPHPAPHPRPGHPARPARGRRPRGDGQSVH